MRVAPRSALLTLCTLLSLPGQAPSPGFASASRYSAIGVQHDIAAMAPSRDGQTIWVAHRDLLFAVDAVGNRSLAYALPGGQWIGALIVDATGEVLFTNGSNQTLLAHDPVTRQTRHLGGIPANTFDLAAVPGSSTLLATANPVWPSPGARPGVWRLDPALGNHREIVQLVGASGPLTFAGNGDLLCATASATFPAPPGSSLLLRFAASRVALALAGGPALTMQDATRVGAPLDAAYDLAIDSRERAYVTGGLLGHVLRIDLASGARAATPWLDTGSAGSTQIAWLPGGTLATFDAFQPADGGRLLVTIANWNGIRSDVVQLEPARPSLVIGPANPVPRGPASINLHGSIAAAPCVLFVSELPAIGEFPLLSWLGVPMFVGLDASVPPLALPLVTDTRGQATWAFTHVGLGGVSLPVQAVSLTGVAGCTSGVTTVQLAR